MPVECLQFLRQVCPVVNYPGVHIVYVSKLHGVCQYGRSNEGDVCWSICYCLLHCINHDQVVTFKRPLLHQHLLGCENGTKHRESSDVEKSNRFLQTRIHCVHWSVSELVTRSIMI